MFCCWWLWFTRPFSLPWPRRPGTLCHEVECDGVLQGVLSVHSCSDPVQVVLHVDSPRFNWSRTFSVTEEQRHCEIDLPTIYGIYPTYSRNASHIQFEVTMLRRGGGGTHCSIHMTVMYIADTELGHACTHGSSIIVC